ncbi:hypothetical protein GE21DRAFT_7507 [Neurospora crassa]|uniref:Glucan 1, 4-alpha-glucosidase n=2 Tax=Neurospora crassa TaxID=5141 RepID=Q1K887_NEUCR|nr:hypothetical protein NCU01085 [Neurospora crassa OR74A]EAA32461.1 hypothetical protein NCU01085 [Neurospora crassa OR74A]KHE88293.1 hypothetical protein GE21DRAFT_7507 [Neurospora crassa]CAD21306.1 related to glucan 1, 4-alpha-glucosidase [Neurospora crassa]|eukprot:XP_961697.1 hypothetical protein NCU01085 [Neurospora crassa OR74A]
MDDPWGSPWATADASTDLGHSLTRRRSDLEPPKRALLSASNSPRLPAITAPSPWADAEDGFGGWAAPDGLTTQTATTAQSAWMGGWRSRSPSLAAPSRDNGFRSRSPSLVAPSRENSWRSRSPSLIAPSRDNGFRSRSPSIAASVRDEEFAKSNPIAWPDTIASSNSPIAPVLRQPSPDPWAAEHSHTPHNDDNITPRLVINLPQSIAEEEDDVDKGKLSELNPDWADEEKDASKDGACEEEQSEPTWAKAETEAEVVQRVPLRISVGSTVNSLPTRSTSPSGDDTDHGDERQDSPITSIDDDSHARPRLARKSSSIVQKPVEEFDKTAQVMSQGPPVIRRAESKSSLGPHHHDVSEEASDFGDFEDAQVKEPPSSQTPEPPSTPSEVQKPSSQHGSSPTTSPTQSMSSQLGHMNELAAKFGALNFDIDLSNVDKMFETSTNMKPLFPYADVSDHIITDSFNSISERKAWYRISRFGSSRKHNAGDDENYRRVAWPTSTVCQETLQTVRRWMEEDSIAGRVSLGGGISKTQKNMFGWDSSAEPVTLDAIFGKRAVPTRPSSVQPLQPPSAFNLVDHSPLGSTAVNSLKMQPHRPASLQLPPAATFSWSSDFSASAGKPPLTASLPLTPSQPAQGPFKVTPMDLGMSSISATAAAEDNDDDWGEMVSSPSVTKATVGGFPDFNSPVSTLTSTRGPNPGTTTAEYMSQSDHVPVSLTLTSNLENNTTVPVTSSAADPWASADFSFFELPSQQQIGPTKSSVTPSRPSSMIATSFAPTAPGSSTHSFDLPRVTTPISSASSVIAPHSSMTRNSSPIAAKGTITSAISSPIARQVTPTQATGDLQQGEPTEDEVTVSSVLGGLPDLSYMLR